MSSDLSGLAGRGEQYVQQQGVGGNGVRAPDQQSRGDGEVPAVPCGDFIRAFHADNGVAGFAFDGRCVSTQHLKDFQASRNGVLPCRPLKRPTAGGYIAVGLNAQHRWITNGNDGCVHGHAHLLRVRFRRAPAAPCNEDAKAYATHSTHGDRTVASEVEHRVGRYRARPDRRPNGQTWLSARLRGLFRASRGYSVWIFGR